MTEVRATLGTYERQLEQDKLTMQGINSATTLAGSVAQGLGLGGGIVIAAFLWGKDIEKLFEQLVGIWPESGSFFSPEWIAKWGDNPLDQQSEKINAPDNDSVNELPPVGNNSFEGKSAYQVYAITASGRQANYDYSKANIINTWLLQQPPTNNLVSPLVGDYRQGLSQEQKAIIISQWHSENPSPPDFLTNDQTALQTQIRETASRRTAAYGIFGALTDSTEPSSNSKYVYDPLLDWLTVASEEPTKLPEWFRWHPSIITGNREAFTIIAIYAWWQPPN